METAKQDQIKILGSKNKLYELKISLGRFNSGLLQVALVVKNPPDNAEDLKDAGSIPGWGRSPWRRAWQSTPLFLPREFHGHRSLVGYSP